MAVTFTLEEGNHYHVDICGISGCDWIIYFKLELYGWLRENITYDKFHTNERDFRDCLTRDATLTFDDDEDAMAFKLVWL